MIRVAINGYGRIGRGLHRQLLNHPDIQVVAINSRAAADSHALLLKRDSVYGTLEVEVRVKGNDLEVNGGVVRVFQEDDPAQVPWDKVGVDVVIESTGKFTTRAKVEGHLKAGARKVIITAPCKDDSVQTIVMGVNHAQFDPNSFDVISNASCTTNALAPTLMILENTFGIESALVTTLHAFTDTQNLLDNSNPKDFRRARATTESIIPTTTGAMEAIDQVIPAMKGKVGGMAFRVPVISVSALYVAAHLQRNVEVDELNEAFLQAENDDLRGIVGTSDEPLVSVDYRGDMRSAILDMLSSRVVNERMAQLVVWYDNEWGYIARVVDLIGWFLRKS